MSELPPSPIKEYVDVKVGEIRREIDTRLDGIDRKLATDNAKMDALSSKIDGVEARTREDIRDLRKAVIDEIRSGRPPPPSPPGTGGRISNLWGNLPLLVKIGIIIGAVLGAAILTLATAFLGVPLA